MYIKLPTTLNICGPQIALALRLVLFLPQMSRVPRPNPPRNGGWAGSMGCPLTQPDCRLLPCTVVVLAPLLPASPPPWPVHLDHSLSPQRRAGSTGCLLTRPNRHPFPHTVVIPALQKEGGGQRRYYRIGEGVAVGPGRHCKYCRYICRQGRHLELSSI